MSAGREVLVARWLFLCCALVALMIVLGGITRLTGSGLSMVRWEPISGVLPPLTHAQWQAELAAYSASPEGRLVNHGLTLEGFQAIFWMEYVHRLVGRLLGLVFAVPLAFFLAKRWVAPRDVRRLVGLLALGGLQGAIGWLMVASGLVDVPHVSPYRLALHLGVGLLLYAGMLWTALELRAGTQGTRLGATPLGLRTGLAAGAVFVTALWGALVAGLKAGFSYNTFPLMDGQWVPEGLLAAAPWWRNAFENVMTVQFLHRWLALSVLTGLVLLWASARRAGAGRPVQRALDGLVLAGLLQVTLGVTTLLLRVPTVLGVLHQAGAVLLLSAALLAAHVVARHPLPLGEGRVRAEPGSTSAAGPRSSPASR